MSKKKFKIYADLDGVLADFSKGFEEVFGMPSIAWRDGGYCFKSAWKVIDRVDSFFYFLEVLEEGRELWEYIKDYAPIILTTPEITVEQCIEDKLYWVRDNLGNYKVLFSLNKEEYANENSILIDDFKSNIDPWVEAGGIGIHFKTSKDAIEELKRLGL